MASVTVIAKNLTGSDIDLVQLALTVPAFGQVTISDFDFFHEITADTQLETEILAGNIILNDGLRDLNLQESINFITPLTSPTGLGFEIVLTAGEALLFGELLAINTSGEVVKASATTSAGLFQVRGVAMKAVTGGSLIPVAKAGSLAPILFSSAPAAISNGNTIFLSTSTAGRGTLSPPIGSGNVAFIVGTLQGADGVTTTPNVIFHPQIITRIV